LGLAFKPNTDDMRDAPAVDLAKAFMAEGAAVKAYDPVAMDVAAGMLPGVKMCQDACAVADQSDALVIVTDWNEFKQLDLLQVRDRMKNPVLYDGRNIYDPKIVRSLGFNYRAVGRGFGGNGAAVHAIKAVTGAA
jgi:UDPglucose 6-dehydrogenase